MMNTWSLADWEITKSTSISEKLWKQWWVMTSFPWHSLPLGMDIILSQNLTIVIWRTCFSPFMPLMLLKGHLHVMNISKSGHLCPHSFMLAYSFFIYIKQNELPFAKQGMQKVIVRYIALFCKSLKWCHKKINDVTRAHTLSMLPLTLLFS